MLILLMIAFVFFFFNDTATTEIYTLSLHDALPICIDATGGFGAGRALAEICTGGLADIDRKSTRLNSSHGYISYAVFCLKKKKKNRTHQIIRSNQSTAASTQRDCTEIYTFCTLPSC